MTSSRHILPTLRFPVSFRDSADPGKREVRARVCDILHAGANAEPGIPRTRETDFHSQEWLNRGMGKENIGSEGSPGICDPTRIKSGA